MVGRLEPINLNASIAQPRFTKCYGCPTDTSRQAYGKSADGRLWALSWLQDIGVDGWWVAAGFNVNGSLPEINLIQGSNAGFIIESYILED